MNTVCAAMLNSMAQMTGQPYKVFDWNKAVDLLIEHSAQTAIAGLRHDLEWTSGTIFKDGKPLLEPGDLDGVTYLASNWAMPILIIDGMEYECYVESRQLQELGKMWTAETYWPEESLEKYNARVTKSV